jgi:hypothetical protein
MGEEEEERERERGRETGNEDGMRERERERDTGERKLRKKVGVLFQERETKQRGKTTDTPIAKAT